MTKPTKTTTILAIYSLAVTLVFGYLISQNYWGLTHAKQVQMTQHSFENYTSNWQIQGPKADATETK